MRADACLSSDRNNCKTRSTSGTSTCPWKGTAGRRPKSSSSATSMWRITTGSSRATSVTSPRAVRPSTYGVSPGSGKATRTAPWPTPRRVILTRPSSGRRAHRTRSGRSRLAGGASRMALLRVANLPLWGGSNESARESDGHEDQAQEALSYPMERVQAAGLRQRFETMQYWPHLGYHQPRDAEWERRSTLPSSFRARFPHPGAGLHSGSSRTNP